jgi:hypothetical protein
MMLIGFRSFSFIFEVKLGSYSVGEVYSNENTWYILYSHEVRRPNSDAYIRFYSQLTNEKVDEINVRTGLNNVIYADNNLTFFPSMTWNIVRNFLIYIIMLFSFEERTILYSIR